MKLTTIAGEPGRYMCESETTPGTSHLVDILENFCGCQDFTCRRRVYQENTGKEYRCKHIRAARDFFTDEVIEAIKEQQLSK